MPKKKKKAVGIDTIIDQMEQKLGELGYTEIVRDLPLVEIDPDLHAFGKLAAMDGDEVAVFCYPVATGLAQEVAVQDEGVFYSRLIKNDRVVFERSRYQLMNKGVKPFREKLIHKLENRIQEDE